MKAEKGSEIITTICEYENSVAMPDNERLTYLDTCGIAHIKDGNGNVKAQEAYANRCSEYLRFGHEVDLAACGAYSPYDALKVCDTPEIFLKTGFEQRPMLYTQKHLFQALTPKTSNRKVVPNMKPIEELRTNKDVAEWCRDFLRITDELSPELAIADRAERSYLMALVGFLVEWCPRKDLSLESLAVLLSADDAAPENDENFKSALDLMFVQIEKGIAYRYVAEYHQYLWVPSKYRRNSDGMKPADRKELVGSEDFALFCWDSVNHLPAIRRISLKASLTSRLIDFKYLREAEAPAYTHGVSNDTFDYEFDDDDDDIPAFSVPEA